MVATATIMVPFVHRSLPGIAFTLPYFAGGVVMYSVYERFGTRRAGAVVCAAGLVAAAFFGMQQLAFAVFGAYLIVFLAQRPNLGSKFASRFGDMSYGLYLFGWPMEQVAKKFSGTSDPIRLIVLALPLIFLFAAISCHAIEQPALSLKKGITFAIRAALQRFLRVPPRSRAFTLGATLCSAVAVPLLLLSEVQWWYVTEGVAELIALALLGGMAASAFVRVTQPSRS
jgi:peptidoglycan/LPS O-acetylase OafA/YrhL